MNWKKAVAILLAFSVLSLPGQALNVPALATPTQEVPLDYASREAQAQDLEEFSGGWHGVVITIVVVALLVWLILELSHAEVSVHTHKHPPAHP